MWRISNTPIRTNDHLEGKAVLWRATTHCTEAGDTFIELWPWKIIRYTTCGAWIDDHRTWDGSKGRFVNLRCTKKFACPTKEEALLRLYHRKRFQIDRIEWELEQAKLTLEILKDIGVPNK